jgi:hypothetical protein
LRAANTGCFTLGKPVPLQALQMCSLIFAVMMDPSCRLTSSVRASLSSENGSNPGLQIGAAVYMERHTSHEPRHYQSRYHLRRCSLLLMSSLLNREHPPRPSVDLPARRQLSARADILSRSETTHAADDAADTGGGRTMEGHEANSTRLRPLSLARYSASSARDVNVSAVSPYTY